MPQKEVNIYTYEIVTQMLKGYRELQRKTLQLEFEITNYIPIATGTDIIDSMTFGKAMDDGFNIIHNGHVSDKTAQIAVSYADKAERLNIKHKQELEDELRSINMEMLRMEYYIGLLEEKHAKVLRLLYYDGLTLVKTAESAKISLDSVKSYRKAGILSLVDMYNRILHS